MPVRSCRVTITDLQSRAHTVDVSAATLFEAVALALKAAQGDKWAPDGFRPVKVQVLDVRAEYEVKLKDFTKWLETKGRSPREVMQRQKIREILGMGIRR